MDDTTEHTHTDESDLPDSSGVAALTPREVHRLREMLEEDPSSGSNRFVWFLIGFVVALASIAVAAIVFLAISDQDDDGNLDLDVPTIEVDG